MLIEEEARLADYYFSKGISILESNDIDTTDIQVRYDHNLVDPFLFFDYAISEFGGEDNGIIEDK